MGNLLARIFGLGHSRPTSRQSSVGTVYFIEAAPPRNWLRPADKHRLVKIGFTTSTVEKRMRSFATGCPFQLRIIAEMQAPMGLEQQLHRAFERHHLEREWFILPPEWGNTLADVLARLGLPPEHVEWHFPSSSVDLAHDEDRRRRHILNLKKWPVIG